MIISRTTSAEQSLPALPAKKQIRPDGTLSKPAPKTLSQSLGSRFYKGMALLLVLVGGCKDANSEKREKAPQQNIQVSLSMTPTVSNLTHLQNKKDKDAEIDRKLAHIENHLFHDHLLNTVDTLGDLFELSNGKGLTAQSLLNKRLTPEVFPVLWKKVLLEGPDEVIVAEFTEPGAFTGEDFARGLRLVLRKEINGLNTSTLLCLDYDEKTGRLKFPEDFFFDDNRKIVPDAIRMLVQYDVPPTKEEFKKHEKAYVNDYFTTGFFGTAISAEIDDSSKVIDLHIYPTRDKNGEYPTGKTGKTIDTVLLSSCVGCHESKKGFGTTGTSFERLQRDIHLQENQDLATEHFLSFTGKNKSFSTPEEKTKTLTTLRGLLHHPKKNLLELLPPGLVETLKRKDETITQPSSVLNRYNALGFLKLTKNK